MGSRYYRLLGILALGSMLMGSGEKKELIERTQVHMATFMTLSLEDNLSHLFGPLFSKIDRFESYFSSFSPTAQLSRLNRHRQLGGVSPELVELLNLSQKIYGETYGYFNISVGSVTKHLYRFGYDDASVPSQEALGSAVITDKPFTIEDRSVTLQKGVTLDLGGVAKGFTADLLKKELNAQGASRFIVALSGDIYCKGSCSVAVVSPFEKDKVYMTLELADCAVSTSGNYERYVKSQHYNHLINPNTKFSQQEVASVTLFSKTLSNARLDAYATALSVMPDALREKFLKEHKEMGYLLILNNGTVFKRR